MLGPWLDSQQQRLLQLGGKAKPGITLLLSQRLSTSERTTDTKLVSSPGCSIRVRFSSWSSTGEWGPSRRVEGDIGWHPASVGGFLLRYLFLTVASINGEKHKGAVGGISVRKIVCVPA